MKNHQLRSKSTSRRELLRAGLTVVSTLVVGRNASADPPEPSSATATPRYRAAIIGHTGAGDYGHGYDQIFNGVDPVSVEALADPDPEGRARAANRSGARRQYSDYREMLAKEKPDLVSIATRHPRHHRDMALAAIEVCRGLFIEKP